MVMEIAGSGSQIRMDPERLNGLMSHSDPSVAMSGQVGSQVKVKVHGSWLIANASTGLYMWMFQGDVLGLFLNLGNALMCAITVGVTLVKRKGHNSRCLAVRDSRASVSQGAGPRQPTPRSLSPKADV